MLFEAVSAVPLVGFEGLDREAQLLAQVAGNPAARRVFLPPGVRHDLGERCAASAGLKFPKNGD
jgi:hypothetical protein